MPAAYLRPAFLSFNILYSDCGVQAYLQTSARHLDVRLL